MEEQPDRHTPNVGEPSSTSTVRGQLTHLSLSVYTMATVPRSMLSIGQVWTAMTGEYACKAHFRFGVQNRATLLDDRSLPSYPPPPPPQHSSSKRLPNEANQALPRERAGFPSTSHHFTPFYLQKNGTNCSSWRSLHAAETREKGVSLSAARRGVIGVEVSERPPRAAYLEADLNTLSTEADRTAAHLNRNTTVIDTVLLVMVERGLGFGSYVNTFAKTKVGSNPASQRRTGFPAKSEACLCSPRGVQNPTRWCIAAIVLPTRPSVSRTTINITGKLYSKNGQTCPPSAIERWRRFCPHGSRPTVSPRAAVAAAARP